MYIDDVRWREHVVKFQRTAHKNVTRRGDRSSSHLAI